MRVLIIASLLAFFMALASAASLVNNHLVDNTSLKNHYKFDKQDTRRLVIRADPAAGSGQGNPGQDGDKPQETAPAGGAPGDKKEAEHGASGGSEEKPKKKKPKTALASPEILTNGTFFYVGVSVSIFLWCTGKAIDMTMDKHERNANIKANL
ncbi:uncharacterized protein BYT42DRAFT_547613 [Radiomyces spectabilis]|uniref:uncharacterized protein n=1 Tax=Radiomyces spectabilis TaxID=64574 RepID=UPI00221EFA8B|nr:uncharacterized protein BYT42DRAFT_547613 [Radiomyces spectabilis]KAI8374595.1 hypothetical protein BYT42DRAFT_547613 [Radiomyces spectabilis]